MSPKSNVPSSFSSTPKMTPVKNRTCCRNKKGRNSKAWCTEKVNRNFMDLCGTFLPALLLNQVKYLFNFFLCRQRRFKCLQFWTIVTNINKGLDKQGILRQLSSSPLMYGPGREPVWLTQAGNRAEFLETGKTGNPGESHLSQQSRKTPQRCLKILPFCYC